MSIARHLSETMGPGRDAASEYLLERVLSGLVLRVV